MELMNWIDQPWLNTARITRFRYVLLFEFCLTKNCSPEHPISSSDESKQNNTQKKCHQPEGRAGNRQTQWA